MKLNQIAIQKVKNLGNYESLRMELGAELVDGDNVNQIVDDFMLFLDWNLNKDIREHKLAEFTAELQNAELPEKLRTPKQAWVDQYYETQAKVDALEFVNNLEDNGQ